VASVASDKKFGLVGIHQKRLEENPTVGSEGDVSKSYISNISKNFPSALFYDPLEINLSLSCSRDGDEVDDLRICSVVWSEYIG
jgi:hypothetical protein